MSERASRSVLILGFGLLGFLGWVSSAAAVGIVNILPDNPFPNENVGVVADLATGDLMDGATVTVQYQNSPILGGGITQETVTFQATGTPGQAIAVGTHFQLELTGDSSANDWNLTVSGNLGSGIMTQMVIDLFPGGAAWDRTLPSPGTPNSGPGQDFTLTAYSTLSDFNITYGGELVPGSSEVFRKMTIDMTMDVSDTASFRADTDLIPEPSTGLLLAGGLVGIAAARRRRSRH